MSGLQFTWLKKGESKSEATPLLLVEALSVRVGIRQVFSNVSFTVYEGDQIRITGPNGSGKSTLLNAIAGIEPVKVESGKIVYNGVEITGFPAYKRAALGIKYMRQFDNIFSGLSVEENLKLALGENGPSLFCKAYPDWVENLRLSKCAGHLSGGQRKKLAWVMTMLSDSYLYLLDEPMAGMEHGAFDEVKRYNEKTMLMIEHF